MTPDESMVAAELAELDLYTGQQARAEAALLRMLPVEWAASVLREDTLDALAGTPKRSSTWVRYLRLEQQVVELRGWKPTAWNPWPSLWHELRLGDEPEPLRWQRRARARGTAWWVVG